MTTIAFTGISGKQYQYTLCDISLPWNAVAANYAFLTRDWRPVYFGETKSLASRQPGPSHPVWTLAKRHNAMFVAAHVSSGDQKARRIEEKDLIQAYDPPANKQHSPATLLGQALDVPAQQQRRNTLLGGK